MQKQNDIKEVLSEVKNQKLDMTSKSKLLAQKLDAQVSTKTSKTEKEKKTSTHTPQTKDVKDFRKALYVAKSEDDFNAHANKHVTVFRDYAHKDLIAYHTTTTMKNKQEVQMSSEIAHQQIKSYLRSLTLNQNFQNSDLRKRFENFGSSCGDCTRNPLMHSYSIRVSDMKQYNEQKAEIDAKLTKDNKNCVYYNENATTRKPKYRFVYVRKLA